jgi:protein BCP1
MSKTSADKSSDSKLPPTDKNGDDSSDDGSSSDDDSLVLEGVLVRNPDASSSSDDSDEDDDDDDDDDDDGDDQEDEKESKKPKAKDNGKRAGSKSMAVPKKKKRKKSSNKPDTINVEFTFCDMDEKYFHGIKSLLHDSSTVYQNQSSNMADLMIENISVGTVVSTADDEDGNVFGYASILNVSTYQDSPVVQYLKDFCLKGCPAKHKKELEVVLSGKTKRPAGFFLHGRMINMPLEIVQVLQQQLVLDMDWAVDNAEGGVEERKSLDFGAFVRLAPCQAEGGSVVYRYFDDEIFAGRAEFVFTTDAPKSFSKEEKQYCNVLVLTKTGHRAAMKDIDKLING